MRGSLADGTPVGRLAAVRLAVGGRGATNLVTLEPGVVRETLTVEGLPLEELEPGTRLRVGAVVIELAAAPDPGELAAGGLRERPSGVDVRARVLTGGVVRVGDPVSIEAMPVPLEDALDLHPFRPEDVVAVVAEYLEQAHAAGLHEVRIVHGRGRGVQRETVRRLLAACPLVVAFEDAPPERGGWGATIVRLQTNPGGELP